MSTLIRHEKGASRRRWRHGIKDLPGRVFFKHRSKVTTDCCVFQFVRPSVDGKYLMRFQIEASVLTFLRRIVDGKYLMRFQIELSIRFRISPQLTMISFYACNLSKMANFQGEIPELSYPIKQSRLAEKYVKLPSSFVITVNTLV